MKLKDLINKVKPNTKPEFSEFQLKLNEIYNFAAEVAGNCEEKFNLTKEEGDFIYNNLVAEIEYFKGYLKE